ncbi:hypothetical protein CLV44_10277 [Marinobacterium halophilum]|uniref:Uncharacterized protein n=2 Tax=Marinobacterium halophilum TaxID=267374 RepID=A0A2P8F357_9GAMM|nr:hypothetical protein CLV44_10277 [Marinobacterium halophilum]
MTAPYDSAMLFKADGYMQFNSTDGDPAESYAQNPISMEQRQINHLVPEAELGLAVDRVKALSKSVAIVHEYDGTPYRTATFFNERNQLCGISETSLAPIQRALLNSTGCTSC